MCGASASAYAVVLTLPQARRYDVAQDGSLVILCVTIAVVTVLSAFIAPSPHSALAGAFFEDGYLGLSQTEKGE